MAKENAQPVSVEEVNSTPVVETPKGPTIEDYRRELERLQGVVKRLYKIINTTLELYISGQE